MRLIGELNDANLAKKFSAYLLTQGVTPKVEPEGNAWEIWVKEEDQLERALQELDQFEKEPDHERYRDSFEKANQIARDEEQKRRKFQKNVVKISKRSGVGKRAPLTLLLIVISSLVALATNFGYSKGSIAIFDHVSELKQPDHVEHDMQRTKMNENRRNQSPQLTTLQACGSHIDIVIKVARVFVLNFYRFRRTN